MATKLVTSKIFSFLTGQKSGGFGSLLGGLVGGGQGGGLNLGSLLGGGLPGIGGLLGLGGIAGAAAPASAMVTAGGLTGLSTSAAGILAGGAGAGIAGGSAAAGGLGGMFGSIAPLLTNPWTLAIAGAAVGGFLLYKFFKKDKSLEKLKEAARAAYGVNIKDDKVLKQIKQVGEGYLGKGAALKNAAQIVQFEEAKNIITAYAEKTGQQTNRLNAENYANVDWSGNQFGTSFSGFGGEGMSASAQAGFNIATGATPITFSSPSFASNNSGGAAVNFQSSGALGTAMQMLANMHSEFLEVTSELKSSIKAVPTGQLVALGLKENTGSAADAVESQFANDPRRTEAFFRNTGQSF